MANPFSWRLIAEKGKQIFKIAKRQQAWAKLRGIVTPCYSSKYLVGLLKQYLVRDNLPLTLRDTLTQALQLYKDKFFNKTIFKLYVLGKLFILIGFTYPLI
jgi:hypothetical protein